MNDVVSRLRHWSHGLTYDPATGLMHEAAAEIARLRLTDEELEAVKAAIDFCEYSANPLPSSEQIAALRKLLERLK